MISNVLAVVFFVVPLATCQDVRLIDAAGGAASVGLLQVRTDAGFGSVCGANSATADVVCKMLGFVSGVVSATPCGFYGGASLCGAAESPVAMADLKCTGEEWSLEDCEWEVPDAACSTHEQDAIVFCQKSSATGQMLEGSARLLAHDGSPALSGVGRPEVFLNGLWTPICGSGFSDGSAAVLCKQMGFAGAGSMGTRACGNVGGHDFCGAAAPSISDLSCAGHEETVLGCPHAKGDDVFCAAAENVVISCAGDGDTQGRPLKEMAPRPSAVLPVLAPSHKK